jgi:hypothetical protein
MAAMPVRPAHPERICWGCGLYCPADDMGCGNGTIRTAHPCELFGDDWLEWTEARHASLGRSHAPVSIGVADDERGLRGI